MGGMSGGGGYGDDYCTSRGSQNIQTKGTTCCSIVFVRLNSHTYNVITCAQITWAVLEAAAAWAE
jgi:hypothetical protein